MKNDFKYFLVDKICKEIAKECKETLEVFKIYAASHSQIMFLLDMDEVATLPKEFH